MRRLALVSLLATVVLAGSVTVASAAINSTQITFLTPTVSPGGYLTLNATAPVGAHCSASLKSDKPGGQLKLGTRHLTTGHAVWRYRLSRQTLPGGWKATVSCSVGGRASRQFTVGAPPVAPAQIEVVKTGFVDQTYSFSSSAFLICGLELKNVSGSDARNLTVNVNFVDTQGSAVATSTTNLSLIPAGQVFYMSCIQQTSVMLTVASVQVSVKVGESTKSTGTLPTVSNLVITPDQNDISQTLTGSLTNTYRTPLSQDATIYALYYDANGNFVGGSQENTGATVEPRASVSFSFADLDPSVTTAEVSVDPCGLAADLGQCTFAVAAPQSRPRVAAWVTCAGRFSARAAEPTR